MHATEEIWLLLLVVPAGQELLWVSDAWSAGFEIQRPTAAESGLDVGLSGIQLISTHHHGPTTSSYIQNQCVDLLHCTFLNGSDCI